MSGKRLYLCSTSLTEFALEFADVTENILKGSSIASILSNPKVLPYFRSLSVRVLHCSLVRKLLISLLGN